MIWETYTNLAMEKLDVLDRLVENWCSISLIIKKREYNLDEFICLVS